MRPANTLEACQEILFRIQTLSPIIVAQTDESSRVTKALIKAIVEANEQNPAQPRTIYLWHHLNGLTLFDSKDNPKIFPPPSDSLKPPAAAYEHILSWGNETGDPSAPTLNNNSVVLVPEYQQLFSDIAPHSTRQTKDGMLSEQIPLCRSAFLRLADPVVPRINKLDIRANYSATKRISIVLIGPNPIHACPTVFDSHISSYLSYVEVPRPSKEEIQSAILNNVNNPKLSSTRTNGPLKDDQTTIEQATSTLTGLTLFETTNAVAISLVKTKGLDTQILTESFRQTIETHPALSLPHYQETWETLVGLERYKRHIEASFHPETLQQTRPRGVILVGVPGTGKSLAAKATGNKLGWPTISANIGRVFGSKVGQSEAQIEQMFRIIDGKGDCVFFIDEIEKALGGMNGSSGDSGVSQRVLNTTLTWLQDRPPGAFIIATCNDLHQLPPEVVRAGRWDTTFFIDVPTRAQRLELLNQQCKEFKLDEFIDLQRREKLAQKTKFWTGADLRNLIQTTRRLLPLHNTAKGPMIQEAIAEALTFIKPLVDTQPDFQKKRAANALIGVPATHQDPDQEINQNELKKIQAGATPIFKADFLTETRDVSFN
jgi:AAA+ superfamily predicted ATPase